MPGLAMAVSLSSSSSSVDPPSLFSTPGVGLAGIFVTGLLVFLLAYLTVVEHSERDRPHLRTLLVATSTPLMVAFAAIIAYESLAVLGVL